jgi:hypothetical protein
MQLSCVHHTISTSAALQIYVTAETPNMGPQIILRWREAGGLTTSAFDTTSRYEHRDLDVSKQSLYTAGLLFLDF